MFLSDSDKAENENIFFTFHERRFHVYIFATANHLELPEASTDTWQMGKVTF